MLKVYCQVLLGTKGLSFFSALFSGRLGLDGKILDEPFEMDETHLADFLNDDLAKLNDADRDTLEQRFNIEEMEDCRY